MALKTVGSDDVPVKYQIPHRERLGEVLTVARQQPISLNMATFWASRRDGKEAGVGCLLGHYVMQKAPKHLELVPLNFLEQIKAPIIASWVFARYPNKEWRHYTLHYHGPEVEAWGLNAALLYFQLRLWDCQTLFWPAGYNTALEVSSNLVGTKLTGFLKAEHAVNATQ